MTTTEFTVTGMTCGHCEMSVREEVEEIPGASVSQHPWIRRSPALQQQARHRAARMQSGSKSTTARRPARRRRSCAISARSTGRTCRCGSPPR